MIAIWLMEGSPVQTVRSGGSSWNKALVHQRKCQEVVCPTKRAAQSIFTRCLLEMRWCRLAGSKDMQRLNPRSLCLQLDHRHRSASSATFFAPHQFKSFPELNWND